MRFALPRQKTRASGVLFMRGGTLLYANHMTRHVPRNLQMNQKFVTYFKRMGIAAFLFFLIKGLAWLVVFYFGWRMVG